MPETLITAPVTAEAVDRLRLGGVDARAIGCAAANNMNAYFCMAEDSE